MGSFEPKLILVPTDFSGAAAHALRYASALGRRFGAHLLVIYADTFIPPVDFTISPAGSFDRPREELVATAREELQAFVREHVPADVPSDVRLVEDMPAESILEQARLNGADLIVMGTHGRTGLRRLLFGSVTEEVMRLAPVPVIAVNESTPETPGMQLVLARVLFSPECQATLRYAAQLAGPEARFVLFRAGEISDRPVTVDDLHSLELGAPEEILDRASLRLVGGMDADDIIEVAKEERPAMIVLATSGERSLLDALRGTVAERVVQHSGCPVLTVNRLAARSLLAASPAPRPAAHA